MGAQVSSTVFAVLYTGVLTLLIGLLIKVTMGLRISTQDEVDGIDVTQHAESAYSLKDEATGYFAGTSPSRPLPGTAEAPVHAKEGSSL